MRNKTTKIPGFLLQEMMVVLAITAIVVGMAFSVLDLVQKQMSSIDDIYEVKLDANKLRQSLWTDFNRYSDIHFNQKKEVLFLSNALEEKWYAFQDTQIITESDTFYIRLDKRAFYFNNGIRKSGEIDAIELKTSKATGHQQIFVFKENSPATYVNQQQ
ncbi:PulJ/GspJ family protein [Maribacter sp.]